MRSHEFIEKKVSRVSEIVGGGLAEPQLPIDQDFSTSTNLGTVDGYVIHGFTYQPIFDTVLAVLDDNGTYKGYIGFNNDGLFVEANTLEQFRRKGIMSTLLLYALRNFKSPLFVRSTTVVSRFSRQLFWSLSEKKKIMITDSEKREYSLEQLSQILSDNWPNKYDLYIYPTHEQLGEQYWEFRNVETGNAYYDKNYLGESIKPYWYD